VQHFHPELGISKVQSHPSGNYDVQEDVADKDLDCEVETVMIKNVPCGCTSQELLDVVHTKGFEELYNFFYMPLRRARENLGYAFIGFPDPAVTKRFAEAMTGFHFASRKSQKVISVKPAKIQGLANCMEHFKDTRTINTKWPPIFICNPSVESAF
jgi:RNA recognition motif-containing protein